MTTMTLRFEVPPECRETFGHELDMLLDQMGPLRAWLERHGGGMQVGD